MSGVRIKDLQSAKPVAEHYFAEFQFVVGAPQPDATLRLSGAAMLRYFTQNKGNVADLQ